MRVFEMNLSDGKTLTDYHREPDGYTLKPNEIEDTQFAVNQGLKDKDGLYNYVFEGGQIRLRTVTEKAPELVAVQDAKKDAILNDPAIKAFIEELETQPQFAGLRGKIEGRL